MNETVNTERVVRAGGLPIPDQGLGLATPVAGRGVGEIAFGVNTSEHTALNA